MTRTLNTMAVVLVAFSFVVCSAPAAARFISVDPVPANSNNGANFNRYDYASNNPYKFTDPDGRCPTGSTAATCVMTTEPKNASNESVQLSGKNEAYVKTFSVTSRVQSGGQSEEQAVAVVSKDGKPQMAQLTNASKTTNEKGDSARGKPPAGTEAIVHGHTTNSVLDQRPLGDSEVPMVNGVPNVTVTGDGSREGVHEIENGALQFRMLKGTMTTTEQSDIQGNLNSAQKVYDQQ